MQIQFKKCSVNHLKELVELGKTTFTESFREDNNPIDFDNYIREAFSEVQLLKELRNTDMSFFLVKEIDTTVGYFKLNQFSAQTELREDEGLEIERIYVKKKFQGRAIGNHMMKYIKELAESLQKDYLWLGVWEKNNGAIRFYEKNGFKKFGKHPYYIGNDKQMDWLMKLDLRTLDT
ncbi:GNAT family N-acetyltransferase [Eudoraea chungangensis]|uniref:GNAT family N-acetyltransferase n=1 Tax=Eudoraea chungangensis TaxID=1481905 RepID=UPI0023EC23B7|nr:GNAT family N-acetyltransferase [Eudoraea chungangensis]